MGTYLGVNFEPYVNYTIAATSTSSNTVVAQPTLGTPATDLLIQNATTSVAFLSWGQSAQTATVAASFPVLPGAIITVRAQQPITNVGVILATGSGNVYVSTGVGN